MDETFSDLSRTLGPVSRRGAHAAAVFDLDRTLIAGASGPAFSEHLARPASSSAGCPAPGSWRSTYRLLGETATTSQVARLAARATAGWPVDAVAAAAEAAADQLVEQVQPYAPGVIEDHRAAGHVLVMATTSPEPLVAPFAARLGFDAVVATRWEAADGAYTGRVDGPLVWGRGKLEAVADWATAAGVDLGSSWMYSDSYYDAPLLGAVGHPTVVNGDVRLVGLARVKGWPVRHFDLPDGVLKIAGRELQGWLRPLQRPELLANIRLDVDGLEHIPSSGPVIVVFNHRSYLDGTVVGAVLGRTGRSFRFLGKKEVFDAPVVGQLAKLAGGIRVNRASGSDEPLEHAVRALQAGDAIAVAPQATIPADPPSSSPSSRVGGARRGWRRRRGRRSSRWGCGAPRWCGPATAGCPGCRSPSGRPSRVRVGPGRPALPQRRRRHEADHGRPGRPAARRGQGPPHPDARGAGGHLSRRLPGRPDARAVPPAGPRHLGERRGRHRPRASSDSNVT